MPKLAANGTFILDDSQGKALRAIWGSPIEKGLMETMFDQWIGVYQERLVDAVEDAEAAELRARVHAIREFRQLVEKTAESLTRPPVSPPSPPML